MFIVTEQKMKSKKKWISFLINSEIWNKSIHLTAIFLIGCTKDFSQMTFLSLHTVNHIEIVYENIQQDNINVLQKYNSTQNYQKPSYIHRIPDQTVGSPNSKNLVFLQAAGSPHLYQFPKKGNRKSNKIRVRSAIDEDNNDKYDPQKDSTSHQNLSQTGMIKYSVKSCMWHFEAHDCFYFHPSHYFPNGCCIGTTLKPSGFSSSKISSGIVLLKTTCFTSTVK